MCMDEDDFDDAIGTCTLSVLYSLYIDIDTCISISYGLGTP